MNYVKDYTPILTPSGTCLSIQAWLCEADNINTPNRFGEYEFSFVPCTVQDHYRLTEAIEQAVWKTEERNYEDPMVQIEAKADCLDRKNGDLEVSLKLHMRDSPTGVVYLNCDYCDFMSPSNGIEDDRVIETPGASEDWDDW